MAATGSEVVILKQLKSLYDALVAKINDVADGTPATGSVTTDSIANGAVTAGKIAADAVTADKIATGAVTSDAIANGTITAADIATGVIPDVSEFITETEADAAYAAKSHTHTAATTSAAGFMSAADKQKLDSLSAPSVDIVKTTTHSTAYTKDTLEIVTDSTGKVTAMYFVNA